MNKKTRTEKDTMGSIEVPADKLWGAQTQRSYQNFRIGWEKMPIPLIKSFLVLKTAAARVNGKLGVLNKKDTDAIEISAMQILEDEMFDEFPLSVWQTGSGTQTNMNVNEVLAHMTGLHPNDHINKGQSSNDTFPTAMHIATVTEVEDKLIPVLKEFKSTLSRLVDDYKDIIKIGRTHLQDATPLTLGQEISGWEEMIGKSLKMIEDSLEGVRNLALGGTAVGTGINTDPDFGELTTKEIKDITGKEFYSAKNKFHQLTSKDEIVFLHGALKALAADLMKIANDVRLLSSGPRSGIGEITIPENEPGSSIMPGKVNPTQCEALTMVCVQIMGNDTTIGFAASQGNYQLNVFMPVIIYNVLQSVQLLSDSVRSFNENCVKGIRPNTETIDRHLFDSLMLVTCLVPEIGYDKSAQIAKEAHKNGTTLKEEAVKQDILSEEEFDKLVDPKKMIR